MSALAVSHVDGPTPCDGCGHRTRCAAEELACKAFDSFANLGTWKRLPRVPSPVRFAKLFAVRDRDLMTKAEAREIERIEKALADRRRA